MIDQARPINRMFSRGLILLSSRPIASSQKCASVEICVREFLTLGHFMAYGEPANFELSVTNLIEEPWQVHGATNH
jgi:hypothetical protein